MNPGELWRLEDGTTRLVLSHATYNVSRANQVVTCQAGLRDVKSFQPFAVVTDHGIVLVDRILTHPRHWLTDRIGALTPDELLTVRTHIAFLLCGQGSRPGT